MSPHLFIPLPPAVVMESDLSPGSGDLRHVGDEGTAICNGGNDLGASSSSSSSTCAAVFPSHYCWDAAGDTETPTPQPLNGDLNARGRCRGWKGGGAVAWGAATAVGRRKDMEDAMAVAPDFMGITCEQVGGCAAPPGSGVAARTRFFGIYDGHGGSQVANYCAKRIHEVVAEEWDGMNNADCWKKRWEAAFYHGFERVDNEIIAEEIAPDIIGSTAVVVIVSGCQIISSNCGDSRAVLCRGNQTIQLTLDHKPDREDELMRIESLGGRVIDWRGPRVLGVLAMSRAIGFCLHPLFAYWLVHLRDRYMRPWVIPVPEVKFISRSEDDECLIVASDGLWEVMSAEEAGDLACRLLRRHRRNGLVDDASPSPAQAAADHLAKLAYRKHSTDNISIIIVDLKSRIRRRPRQ